MPSELAQHWRLAPDVDFLNHGSFGACPGKVLDHQQDLRAELERQPIDFFVRQYFARLDEARVRLAEFLGADPQGLVAVSNATSGVNAVLRSLRFEPGDELLTTDHAYNACRNALEFVADRWGAKSVVARLPFPVDDPAAVADAILRHAGPRTRLALLDHVTSSTGLVMPLETIVRQLDERGVDALVDGAHAPGMLPLALDSLGAAYYTGNCHKWLCAPKGAAFLWVREDRREAVRPLTISHGANSRRDGRSRLHDEFDWTGTNDPTAFLSVPAAIDLLGSLLPGGWREVMRTNHELAVAARRLLAEALGVAPPCPDAMVGSLASLPLPESAEEEPSGFPKVDPLENRLVTEHRIQVQISARAEPPRRLLRVSAQLYNDLEQYRRLAELLPRYLGLSGSRVD